MRKLFTFTVLMGIWCVLSGQFDSFHLSLGVFSCALVTYLTSAYLYDATSPGTRALITPALRLIPYSLWLVKEIFLANVHVWRLAVIPGAMREVNPMLIRFQTQLKSPVARYLLANSITLTPGTVTLKLEDDSLYVHSISAKTTIGLEGDMEQRIARVFGEHVINKPQTSTFE